VAPSNDRIVPFGSVAVGATSDATITITSNGSAALGIGTVAGADPLSAPFSITSDTCSNQSLAPSQTCVLTVRYAPTANASSSDTFDIPNNDLDTPAIIITLTGSGAAAGNNPPSAPVLIAPTNGQTGLGTAVAFSWTKAVDPDGDAVTHRFQNCTDPSFSAAACAPVDVAAAQTPGITYAGLGGLGAGIILIGFVAGSGFKRSRKALVLMLALLLTGTLFMSCKSSSGGGGAPAEGQYSVSGLAPGTTYYWKVTADDGKGGTAASETWSYTTQ
jgi:hypothetical protein